MMPPWTTVGRLALTVLAALAPGLAAAQNWTEVVSPRFTVLTPEGEAIARNVAVDLERVHAFFAQTLPDGVDDPLRPVTVFVVEDGDDLADLIPRYTDGPRPGGIFRAGPFKNHIVLRLDAGRQTVYHEYFHLLTRLTLAGRLPLWLREGMAEFYSNADIDGDRASYGRPDPDAVRYLRDRRVALRDLLALTTNPHDGAGDVGAFYAQSWALTHFLMLGNEELVRQRALESYVALVQQGVDQVEAFTQAVGDLEQMDTELADYVRRLVFGQLERPFDDPVEETSFVARELSPAEALARRAQIRHWGGDPSGALAMVDEATTQDDALALAQDVKGRLHLDEGRNDLALEAFGAAARLGSSDFATHYLLATLSPQSTTEDAHGGRLSTLRTSMELNPRFPLTHRALARSYVEMLDFPQAVAFARSALDLDRTDPTAWATLGLVFLDMGDVEAARTTLERARTWMPDAGAASGLAPLAGAIERNDEVLVENERRRDAPRRRTRTIVPVAPPPAADEPASPPPRPPAVRTRSDGTLEVSGGWIELRCAPDGLEFVVEAAGRFYVARSAATAPVEIVDPGGQVSDEVNCGPVDRRIILEVVPDPGQEASPRVAGTLVGLRFP